MLKQLNRGFVLENKIKIVKELCFLIEMIEKKAVTINDLPEEVLQYTLSFLDVDSSRKAALACRKFYELICHLQRDKFIAVIECAAVSLNNI